MSENENPIREPWEQRENEGPKAFSAFVAYRDLGLDRSLNKAYRELNNGKGEATGTWQAWSVDHEWVARCRAYDAYCDQVRRRARERKLEELEERRAAFEFENQGLLENWVRQLDDKLWKTIEGGFTEVKENLVRDPDSGNLVVLKRETRVKFPTMSSFARALDTRNDTARQAVEGPRKDPSSAPLSAKPAADTPAVNTATKNEFVWVAPPSEPEADSDQAEPQSPEKGGDQ